MAADKYDNDQTRSFTVMTAGTIVSHYKIISELGARGIGEVYLADDTKLRRKVALKFLPSHLCQDKDAKARFIREAQAAARIDHANIVSVYEVGEHQGRPFLAMQHIQGDSLCDVIKQKKLPLGSVIDLAIEISEGLLKAHQVGVIHRDIKPSNIVIDSDGRPILLCCALTDVQGMDKITKGGSTVSTIGFMSPEQIHVKEADQRSDLFSLGVVFYLMITGRQPFKGDTEAAIMDSVLNDALEPLSRYRTGVFAGLQSIISKLLEKDPGLRYKSAAGVITDLKKLAHTDVAGASSKAPWSALKRIVAAIVGTIAFLAAVVAVLHYIEGKLQNRPDFLARVSQTVRGVPVNLDIDQPPAASKKFLELEKHLNPIPDHGIQLDPKVLIQIGNLEFTLGRTEMSLAYYSEGLASAGLHKDSILRGVCLNNIALVHQYGGEYEYAIDRFLKALKVHGAANFNQGVADAYCDLSYLYLWLGRPDSALTYAKGALEVYLDIPYSRGIGKTQAILGQIHRISGNMDIALDFHYRALRSYQGIQYQQGEATVLRNIGLIFQDMGYLDSALHYEKQALSIGRELGNRQTEAVALGNIGVVCEVKGQLDSALGYHQDALTISHEIGYRHGEATQLSNIGTVYWRKAQLDSALQFHQDALAIHREIGYRQGEAADLGNIALVYREKGQLDSALGYYQDALTISHEIGYRQGDAVAFQNIGVVYHVKGQVDSALYYYDRALSIHREIDYQLGQAAALGSIGQIYQDVGHLDSALQHLQCALAMSREIGWKQGEAAVLASIGQIYQDIGHLDSALVYVTQALSAGREMGDRQTEAAALGSIGLIHYVYGQTDSALYYYQLSLVLDKEIGYRQGEATDLCYIGVIYLAKDQLDSALQYFQYALAMNREIGYREGEASVLGNIGLICEGRGQLDSALQYHKDALVIHREIGHRRFEAVTLGNIGLIYKAKDDRQMALKYLVEAVEMMKKHGFSYGLATCEEAIKELQSEPEGTE